MRVDIPSYDVNIRSIDSMLSPAEIASRYPVDEDMAKRIKGYRDSVRAILSGEDRRLLAIVGPCSIHDTEAALDYARRLKALSDKLSDRFFFVMRTYFEKPRTTVGWKGLINDPDMDGSCRINHGLIRVAAAKEIFLGLMRLDAILHIELHVNDVLIVGKHQRFLKTLRRAAHTDLGLAHTRNVDDFDVLHGPGHAPVNAGCAVLRVLAECRHHTDLTFGNDVDAAGKPGNSSHAHEAGDAAHRK